MVTVWRFTVTSVIKIWSATGDRAIQYAAPRRGGGGGGGATLAGSSPQESSSSGCGASGGGRAPFGSAGAVALGCVSVRRSRSGGICVSASSGECGARRWPVLGAAASAAGDTGAADPPSGAAGGGDNVTCGVRPPFTLVDSCRFVGGLIVIVTPIFPDSLESTSALRFPGGGFRSSEPLRARSAGECSRSLFRPWRRNSSPLSKLSMSRWSRMFSSGSHVLCFGFHPFHFT